jgi:hypothetical protein
MLDGLWAGYTNASIGDFPTVLKRIKLLGFNGLRLPFTFQDLDRAPNKNIYVSGCMVGGTGGQSCSLLPCGAMAAAVQHCCLARCSC